MAAQSTPANDTGSIRTLPSSALSSIRKSPSSPAAHSVPDRSRRKAMTGRLVGATFTSLGDEGHGARRARRIEPRQPTVRAYPVHARARLDEAVDRHRGQTLAFAVVDEAMAVEPAEPVDRAEPQKTARVLYDAEDAVVAETIRRGIRARRQAFSERLRSAERNEGDADNQATPDAHRRSWSPVTRPWSPVGGPWSEVPGQDCCWFNQPESAIARSSQRASC